MFWSIVSATLALEYIRDDYDESHEMDFMICADLLSNYPKLIIIIYYCVDYFNQVADQLRFVLPTRSMCRLQDLCGHLVGLL